MFPGNSLDHSLPPVKDAFREVEEILKASHTGDPEEILRRLEGQELRLRPISVASFWSFQYLT